MMGMIEKITRSTIPPTGQGTVQQQRPQNQQYRALSGQGARVTRNNINGESRTQSTDNGPQLSSWSSLLNFTAGLWSLVDAVKEPFLKLLSLTNKDPTTQTPTLHQPQTTTSVNPRSYPRTQFYQQRGRARTKLAKIREDRQKSILSCLRCCEKNHHSRDCRNSIVYFECGKIGHRSHNCRSIAPRPPPLTTYKPITPSTQNLYLQQWIVPRAITKPWFDCTIMMRIRHSITFFKRLGYQRWEKNGSYVHPD